MKRRRLVIRLLVVVIGLPMLLIAGLWYLPLNSAMLNPLYWKLADLLAKEELIDLIKKDVTAEACPLVTRETVSQVAQYRNYPADSLFSAREFWTLQEAKSPAQICSTYRLRVLSFRFDRVTGACSAEADTIPQCDF